jgi:hypothetical protein
MFATEWYKGTIVSINPDSATYNVEYEDGDEMDEGLSRVCVRAYKPLEVDDVVAVRSEDLEYVNGRVVKVHPDGTVDIDTPFLGLFERVTTLDIRRFDPEERFEEGSPVFALFQGGDEWYGAVVSKVNADGTYDLEYEDGDTEFGVEAAYIRRVTHIDQHFTVNSM